MADANGAFLNTVRGTLVTAEEELVNDGVDREKVQSALEDLRSVLRPISMRHFETRGGFKHKVGDFYPMLQRQAIGWLKQFQRRMSPRCSVKHPWQVIVEDKLTREHFGILEATVTRTNFGVITVKRQRNCVFAFTSYHRVRKVFSDLTDQTLTKESFLKRKFKGGKRAEAIVGTSKQFGMKYCFKKELMTFDFYYGLWNEHGWPQHV